MQILATSTIQKDLEELNPVNKFPGTPLPNAAYPIKPHDKYNAVVTRIASEVAFFMTFILTWTRFQSVLDISKN